MSDMKSAPNAVESAFGTPWSPRDEVIPAATVVGWMQSTDSEIVGAIYKYLLKTRYLSRIAPPISADVITEFKLRHLEQCLVADIKPKEGSWVYTRYEAGHDIAAMFVRLWFATDRVSNEKFIRKVKDKLSTLYLAGDDSLRKCIIDAALEHMFEHPAIVKYFEDWKHHPQLSTAYQEALEWAADAKK
jgi:hypothetical protein